MPTFTWKDNAAYKWHNRTTYIWHDVTILASYIIACLCFAAKQPTAALSVLKPLLSFAASLAAVTFTSIQTAVAATVSSMYPSVSFSCASPSSSFSDDYAEISFARLTSMETIMQGKATASMEVKKPGYSITRKIPTVTFEVETRDGCNCA